MYHLCESNFCDSYSRNIVGNGCLWKKTDIQYIPQTSTFSNTMIYFSCVSFPGTYLSGRNVTAGYNLTVNQPPGVGNCSITPQSGLTLLTGFNVSCQGFSDPDSPLLYILSQVQTSGNVLQIYCSHFYAPLQFTQRSRVSDHILQRCCTLCFCYLNIYTFCFYSVVVLSTSSNLKSL